MNDQDRIIYLANLAGQAERAEAEQVEGEFIGREQPSRDDLESAREKAAWLVGGLDVLTKKMYPFVVMDDEYLNEGVDKLTPVTLKYAGGELPPWLASLMKYKDEFMAGAWFAGFCWGVRQQVKQHEAEEQQRQAQAEAEAENETDQEASNNGNQ